MPSCYSFPTLHPAPGYGILLAVRKTRSPHARELIHGPKDHSRAGCPRSLFGVRRRGPGSTGPESTSQIASEFGPAQHHSKPGVRASCSASTRPTPAAASDDDGATVAHRHAFDARRRGNSERCVCSWSGLRAAVAGARAARPAAAADDPPPQSRRIYLSISTGTADVQLNVLTVGCLAPIGGRIGC